MAMQKSNRTQIKDLAVTAHEMAPQEMMNLKGGKDVVVVDGKGNTWKPTPLPRDTTGGPVVLPPTQDPTFKPTQK